MEKGINMVIADTMEQISEACAKSGLPSTVLELILRQTLSTIGMIAKDQVEKERSEYAIALKKEK